MIKNPAYINNSLWIQYQGSFIEVLKKEDYFYIYDYWTWDEKIIESTLLINTIGN